MFDIRAIRDNPELFDAGWRARGLEPQAARVIELDAWRRDCQTELQELQARRNEISRLIGQRKAQGEDADDLIEEVGEIKTRMPELEERERTLGEDLNGLLTGLPNIPAEDTPVGEDEFRQPRGQDLGQAW